MYTQIPLPCSTECVRILSEITKLLKNLVTLIKKKPQKVKSGLAAVKS